jgi:hypothetical protein
VDTQRYTRDEKYTDFYGGYVNVACIGSTSEIFSTAAYEKPLIAGILLRLFLAVSPIGPGLC